MQIYIHGLRAWKSPDGKGALGCLLFLVLAGIGIFVGMRVGPPYFAYKGLETDVKTEISRAGAHFYSDDVLVQNILDLARKNEVRLKRENVKVERYAGQVNVLVHYSVPVDLLVTKHTFDFDIKASSFVGSL